MLEIEQYMVNELGGADAVANLMNPVPVVTEIVPTPVTVITTTVVPATEIDVDGRIYVKTAGKLYIKTAQGKQCFVASYIEVIANARNYGGQSWGKIVQFSDMDKKTKKLFISNSDIVANSQAVIKDLADVGLVISSDHNSVNSLLHYINLAKPVKSVNAICTDRIGWHGNIYLFHDNTFIGSSTEQYIYTGAPTGNHFAVKGTAQSWKESVATLCKGNTLLLVAVNVSLAAVLLRLLKMESGGYHFYGESSTGKTTTLHVAGSVHGDPDQMIGTWRSTTNGAEGRAKKFNDSLLIMDELHQSNPKDAGEAAYMLFNGKGKQRSSVLGEARAVSEWRLNCLSSGEMPYAAFIQEGGKNSRAGQEIRMLDVPADMEAGYGAFEDIHGAKDSHAFAELIKKACADNYGAPIREFLQKLTEYEQLQRLESDFIGVKERFITDYVPADASGQVQRVASKMAVVALAGELATGFGLTGWDTAEAYEAVGRTFTRWLSNRGTVGQQEAEKAVEQARNFFLRNGNSRFLHIHIERGNQYTLFNPTSTCHNLAGYKLLNSNHNFEYIVFPDVLKEMCAGLNLTYAIKTFIERGYLKTEPDGKAQVRHRLPGMGQKRVYHFTDTLLSDAEEPVTEADTLEVEE